MLHIGICEDIKDELMRHKTLVEKIMKQLSLNAEIFCFQSGEDLLCEIENRGKMDIILMDIEMQGKSGVETAKIIRETDFQVILIFISLYDKYFREMINVQPFSFIDKPVSEEELREVLKRALDIIIDGYETFKFVNNKVHYQLAISKIRYFESDKRKIILYSIDDSDDTYAFYRKLDDVEKEINASKNRFIRVHKSFLLNPNYIKEYRYDKVIMDDRREITISEKYRDSVKQFYLEKVRTSR